MSNIDFLSPFNVFRISNVITFGLVYYATYFILYHTRDKNEEFGLVNNFIKTILYGFIPYYLLALLVNINIDKNIEED